jgi:hypothetical protein
MKNAKAALHDKRETVKQRLNQTEVQHQ